MKIGIEAERANHPQKTGVEHYAKQLILELARIDKENRYTLYLRSKPEAWFLSLPENFSVKVMPFPIFWTQIRISMEMIFHPVDVLFVPASSMPLIHAKKTVVTVHDLAFMFFPNAYTRFQLALHKLEDWLVKIFAYKIIAVSESTKKDLIKFYKVDPKRVIVVLHGYGAGADKKIKPGSLAFPEKYVLFLSTLQPRKNLIRLIEAFRMLKNEHPDLPHKLVVVGKAGWKSEPILKEIEKNKDIVCYLNHISDEEKNWILCRASMLVGPSLYEGFGMWILEAFGADVPVGLSNISSMPEIARDAAIYFNPEDPRDIKEAMVKVLFDKSLSDNLVMKGRERLKYFSWNKCARETLNVLKS